MNIFKKIYCRSFQFVMRTALPFLSYREPELIDGTEGVPAVLKNHQIERVMLITDQGVYRLGLCQGFGGSYCAPP